MKSLGGFTLHLLLYLLAVGCWFAMAGLASAQEYECTARASFPQAGRALPVVDGRVLFCTPVEHWPTDGRENWQIAHSDEPGGYPITCDFKVADEPTVRISDLEPGVMVESPEYLDLFGLVACSVDCFGEAGGNPWDGQCEFPDRDAAPLGGIGYPVQAAERGPLDPR